MTDASAARHRAVFEFKSATLPLIAVILKTGDLGVLRTALDAQLADSPDFFEQEPVVIDLSQLSEADQHTPIDFVSLRAILSRHQTQPVAVRLSKPLQSVLWPRLMGATCLRRARCASGDPVRRAGGERFRGIGGWVEQARG